MTTIWRLFSLLMLAAALSAPIYALAQTAPFDLVGPKLTAKVTHAGATLPISETPNLSEGDQVWIKAELPPGQSVNYLMVVAFMRGATNPPPQDWFFRSETWTRKGQGGLKVSVPKGAQQVLVFMAPQTGGDFATITSAVRGKPGAFVRASQDLNQASLDRSRLDAFLAAIRRSDPPDADHLKTVSPLLARSLAIKLNPDCLNRAPELQAPCLMEGREALVLSDGHSASIVQALTSGTSVDLIQQLSGTPQAKYGYYSPYVGAIMDFARILDSFHTAQFQYIPALTIGQGDQLSLVLNTAPSFHNPMSVLVTALPPIEAPQPPPLQPVDAKEAYCVAEPRLVLPVEGAPLAFSTAYAHDMVLRLKRPGGATVDLPVTANAEKGGFVVNASTASGDFDGVQEGTLRGFWGFTAFEGPTFRLQEANAAPWTLAADDQQSLIVGRDDAVRLRSPKAACVESLTLQQAGGEPDKVEWKRTQPDELAVTLPLKQSEAGSIKLLVKQYGQSKPEEVSLQSLDRAIHVESFSFHAGDPSGVLKGTRLDEVAKLTLRDTVFQPAGLKTVNGEDELTMVAADPAPLGRFRNGDSATAKVAFRNGRSATIRLSIAPPRPHIAVMSKTIQPPAGGAAPGIIQLGGADELAQGAVLSFSIHAEGATTFTGTEKVEIAGADDGATTTLGFPTALVLEDSKVILATLNTSSVLGPSTFGPLRFRLVAGGMASDWQPLVTLVRLPTLKELKCGARGQGCELSGANLFLIEALATDAAFEHPAPVPEGFTGYALRVPRPATGRLYLKLHDDPSVISEAAFPREGERPTHIAPAAHP